MTTDAAACELCTPNEVLFENSLAYVRYDSRSLSRGHVLVIPKRHVASFFDMNAEEQAAVLGGCDGPARRHSLRAIEEPRCCLTARW